MRLHGRIRIVLATIAGLILLGAVSAAPARASDAAGDRPLYLDIVGTRASQTVLPDDLIAAMAREVLSQSGRAVIGVGDGNPPSGVRVLRIMVLVSESQDATGTVIAAAATTSLLHTPAGGSGDTATRSLYQGMQQEMATGPDENSVQDALRGLFKTELQKRIRAALSALR